MILRADSHKVSQGNETYSFKERWKAHILEHLFSIMHLFPAPLLPILFHEYMKKHCNVKIEDHDISFSIFILFYIVFVNLRLVWHISWVYQFFERFRILILGIGVLLQNPIGVVEHGRYF